MQQDLFALNVNYKASVVVLIFLSICSRELLKILNSCPRFLTKVPELSLVVQK